MYSSPKEIDSSINVTLLLEEAVSGPGAPFDPASTDDCEDHEDYYRAGCQAWFPAIVPKAGCAAGDPAGRRTVALVGDSKAAQWSRTRVPKCFLPSLGLNPHLHLSAFPPLPFVPLPLSASPTQSYPRSQPFSIFAFPSP